MRLWMIKMKNIFILGKLKKALVRIDNKVLLNGEEIDQYNKKVMSKCQELYDLDSLNLKKTEILNYITSYKMPSSPQHDFNKLITEEVKNKILANRNLENIDVSNIRKGIVIKRTNLRAFPTAKPFFNLDDKGTFDNIEESALYLNTPILILHESQDKKWQFVLTSFYFGWVKKADIAYAKEEDYAYFINNPSFGVIIAPKVISKNFYLDMSVKLPLLGKNIFGYTFSVPSKGKDGFVKRKKLVISKNKVSIGYLPYTKQNIYRQASKYLGTSYSWGGKDSGVDCSSYLNNIYHTFGFKFPRNTKSQRESIGYFLDTTNSSITTKKHLLMRQAPAIIFMPGHVMLYLGIKNFKYYIIHASSKKMQVILTELTDNSIYLNRMDRIVLIKPDI